MIRFKILLIKGEPLGGKGSLGLNLLIFFLNPFWLPRSAIKPPPCYFTLCLMPDDFTCQGRASGWERVRTRNTKYFTLYIYMYLTWGSLTLAPKTSLYNLVAFSIYNWSNFTKYIYIYIQLFQLEIPVISHNSFQNQSVLAFSPRLFTAMATWFNFPKFHILSLRFFEKENKITAPN